MLKSGVIVRSGEVVGAVKCSKQMKGEGDIKKVKLGIVDGVRAERI